MSMWNRRGYWSANEAPLLLILSFCTVWIWLIFLSLEICPNCPVKFCLEKFSLTFCFISCPWHGEVKVPCRKINWQGGQAWPAQNFITLESGLSIRSWEISLKNARIKGSFGEPSWPSSWRSNWRMPENAVAKDMHVIPGDRIFPGLVTTE